MVHVVSDVRIQALSLGLDFITEQRKRIPLNAPIEVRRWERAQFLSYAEPKRENLKERKKQQAHLAGDDSVYVLHGMNQFDIACAHVHLSVYDIDMQATITLVTYQQCVLA